MEDTKQKFMEFVKDKKKIIGKRNLGGGGNQVWTFKLDETTDLDDFFNELINREINLLEERIIQHKELNNLYPNSVNTIRFITLLTDGGVKILYAFLRIGKNAYVDNLSRGGMVVPIDKDTGTISQPASDIFGNVYYNHPVTNSSFIGFKVPRWKECCDLVKEVADNIPEVRYVGWDIAITDKAAILIEGNYYQGHRFWQLPVHTPNKIGVLKDFETIIKGCNF